MSNTPNKKRGFIFAMQGQRCFYCNQKKSINEVSSDHVFPRSYGYGLNHNHVVACHRCNSKKQNRFPTIEEVERVCILYEKMNRIFDPTLHHERSRSPFLEVKRFFIDAVGYNPALNRHEYSPYQSSKQLNELYRSGT